MSGERGKVRRCVSWDGNLEQNPAKLRPATAYESAKNKNVSRIALNSFPSVRRVVGAQSWLAGRDY